MMRGHEKSDSVIVAAKPANKAEQSAAEPVEPRAGTKGNASQQSTCPTTSRVSVSQALEHIRRIARERKKERFTALFHHPNIDLLEEAFFELKEDAAPGVDRLTWTDYEADLKRTLENLHGRVQREAYRALPSRRGYIPKPDGGQRPAIRSVVHEIRQEEMTRLLAHACRGDRRIIRLIQKWLKAGVLEAGAVSVSDKGTGQGSVISPLLANIYLHYALDLWAVRWRRREATGDMVIVRYADDFIVGFQHEID